MDIVKEPFEGWVGGNVVNVLAGEPQLLVRSTNPVLFQPHHAYVKDKLLSSFNMYF